MSDKKDSEALVACPFCHTKSQILDDTEKDGDFNYVECTCGFICSVDHWNKVAAGMEKPWLEALLLKGRNAIAGGDSSDKQMLLEQLVMTAHPEWFGEHGQVKETTEKDDDDE